MIRRRPAVLLALAMALVLMTMTPAKGDPASGLSPSDVEVEAAKCGGVFLGEIIAGDGVQRLETCRFNFSGNPIEVKATDLGVTLPLPPVVFVAVIAFPGFPPRPEIVAQCSGIINCRGRGNYTPTGPFGDRLFCVFGALSATVTVEVLWRYSCSSGDGGLPGPL
jgi:hypothetical protein